MHLTIINATGDSVVIEHNGAAQSLQAFTSADISLKWNSKMRLCTSGVQEKTGSVAPFISFTRRRLITCSSWSPLTTHKDVPWRIYNIKVSNKHRKLIINHKRDLSAFLSQIPDSASLCDIVLPGTHDTMAFYGWPISQCQSSATPLTAQLAAGIRVIDIRLACKNSRLIAYHGIYPQRTPFDSILDDIHAFLTTPTSSKETIVMSIKQEDYMDVPALTFSAAVHDAISKGPGGLDIWYLQNRVPFLGEVRGKVVLLSRFGANGDGWDGGLEGLGIHPISWPDSDKSGFSWQCKDTLVSTHDWYNIGSVFAVPEKVSLATQNLLPPVNNPPMPILAISYFSAASFPLAFPPAVARGFGWPSIGLGVEGVNQRVGKWLLDLMGNTEALQSQQSEKKDLNDNNIQRLIRGWALFDFFAAPEGGALVPLLVEANFRTAIQKVPPTSTSTMES